MSGLSAALAARCAADWRERLPRADQDAMRATVRRALVDTAACILAGRDDPAVAAALRWTAEAAPAQGDVPVLFGEQRRPVPRAALVNGVAGHALDYDDVGLAGHPSVVLVPALLAEHDRSGLAGFDLVQAYAKGYAVWAELQRRLATGLHARGWHPSAVFGTLAAAAAIGSARRLPAAHLAHALGLAASWAGGVVANFGSMAKPLHIGRAAESGFSAAGLAALGVDASADALDGPSGLLAALVGRDHVDRQAPLADGFEATLLRQPPGIKKYPVCYAAHRVVDGILDLARAHGFAPDEVAQVDATVSATAAAVLRQHGPTTVTEARFSLEFAVATALVRGGLGMREVAQDSLADPAVRRLLALVRTHTTDTSCPLEPSFAYCDEVRVTLRDGRVLASGPIRFARGHAERPLDDAALAAKLLGCVQPGEEGLARAVLDRIESALER